MTITIPLAFGRKASVSPEDEARIRQHAWFERKARGGNYYAHAYIDGRMISMHRFILELQKGVGTVDHIDRNGLNNTRENIRVVSPQQNASRRIDSRKSNGLRGASRHHRGRQWVAQITVHGKRRYLGCFDTEIEASAAYFAAASEAFGDFSPTPPPAVAAFLAAQSYRQADAYAGHLPATPQHPHYQPAGHPAGGEHAAVESQDPNDVRRRYRH